MLWGDLRALALGLVLILAPMASASGAAFRLGEQEAAKLERKLGAFHQVLSERAPGLLDPLVEVEPATASPTCDPHRAPVTHAILVGASEPGGMSKSFRLPGAANDVEMFGTLLLDRGVSPARIHRLSGQGADRGAIAAAMSAVLDEVRCDDRVFFSFSGPASPTRQLVQRLFKERDARVPESDWELFFSSEEKVSNLIDDLRGRLERLSSRLVPQALPLAELLSLEDDELAFLAHGPEEKIYSVFLSGDLSAFMVAVRNKGAHAIAIVDTAHAAHSRLGESQREADLDSLWTYRYQRKQSHLPANAGPKLVAGHGSYTVFYAGMSGEETPEMPLPRNAPDARQFGLFSFTIGGELLENVSATPRSIADAIQRSYSSGGARPSPSVETSAPDLVLVAEAAPPRQDPIRIISPAPQRGAAKMPRAEIEIEGRVEWSAPVLGVFVAGADAELAPGGHFRKTVTLKPGLNVIDVRAVTADNRMLSRKLELMFEGDRQALVGDGRRYAVIIANQTYGGGTGMPSLATPFADADAIAKVLTAGYGYETELPVGEGRTLPLILKDPTKREIQSTLHHLGKVVGSKDSVLIFYAGHGVYEEVTATAYWVPSDAEKGYEPSYLSAADISAAIQRMQAGKVILISDSCYSGALMRGGSEGEAEPVADPDRMELLLRLQASRSRIVISSGNNEPVADGGGDGHSVFARALLTGLEKMQHDAFSARELFGEYILEPVAANSGQEPQFRPLEKVGHEGGDFVFVKVQAEEVSVQ